MNHLYISDLDGTLLQSNARLSKRAVTILNELIDSGVNFTVATARSAASVPPILAGVHIKLPIVLMNGVCLYDLKEREYLRVETLSEQSTDFLLDFIHTHHLKGFVYTLKDGIMNTYYEEIGNRTMKSFYRERVKKYNKSFTQVSDFRSLEKEPLIYFTIMDTQESFEPLKPILEASSDLNHTIYRDHNSPDIWYLEVFSKNASKYHGVQRLRSILGAEAITCFGDNRNDIPLFQGADTKIAVGNAVDELKELADYIIRPYTEDGVPLWLKQYAKPN